MMIEEMTRVFPSGIVSCNLDELARHFDAYIRIKPGLACVTAADYEQRRNAVSALRSSFWSVLRPTMAMQALFGFSFIHYEGKRVGVTGLKER